MTCSSFVGGMADIRLIGLMDALGHERFAVVGHDTGFAIRYALATDHPDRVERVALAHDCSSALVPWRAV